MALDLSGIDLAALGADQVRALLPPWLASTVEGPLGAAVEEAVRTLVVATPDDELRLAVQGLAQLGSEFRPYPADPFARRLSRIYMAELVSPDSGVQGAEHLAAALAAGPTLLLGNHRSYVDTQLTDLLLARLDPTLADRLATVAGPKVYADPFRRLAALGLHTVKTAQSTAVASGEAVLSVREVARIALQTVEQAHQLMAAGHAVLLYPEGTRSRDGQLGPLLRGAGRYATLPGTRVVPVALTGSEQVFPIGAERLHRARVHLRLGAPFLADDLDKDQVLAEARTRLEALLQP